MPTNKDTSDNDAISPLPVGKTMLLLVFLKLFFFKEQTARPRDSSLRNILLFHCSKVEIVPVG